MIELLVPYKPDCTERVNNRRIFLAHYTPSYNVTIIDDYVERAVAYNTSARRSHAKYIALADIDAIISHCQINKALEMLEDGYDLVYPFTDVINLHPDGSQTDDWPKIDKLKCGLMVFFNRQRFLEFGAENEQFIGYGWEDHERYYRSLNNRYKIGRVEGICHHLVHPRTGFQNPNLYHNMHLMKKEKQKWISSGQTPVV
jgi:hypothetical protein